MKRGILVVLAVFFVSLVLLGLFIIRLILPVQLDDVSPGIPCEKELLDKADVFFVIPLFDNKSIANDKEWCNQILSLNKTLAMHGVFHGYKEFLQKRDDSYLERGVVEFEKCFNLTPVEFKPPQLAISKENKRLVESKMKKYGYFNQITHKVYHCNDTGRFSNRMIDLV